jgi:hypothetical protein
MSGSNASSLPWRRLAGEALLIIVSVFVAIALESLWQERQKAAEAREGLEQVLLELQQDRSDVDAVAARQAQLDQMYIELQEWLGNPDTVPADQLTRYLDDMTYDNRTLFARRSAWTMMVESGFLPLLDDPPLVGRMANFYEDMTARLDFNNGNYDDEFFTIIRDTGSGVWDSTNGRFRNLDPEAIGRFRDQLRYLHRVWNLWYLDFLSDYAAASDALIEEIESYLATGS